MQACFDHRNFDACSFVRCFKLLHNFICGLQFLNVPMFRNVTMKCLTEIGELMCVLINPLVEKTVSVVDSVLFTLLTAVRPVLPSA
jgi:hypothetical protein